MTGTTRTLTYPPEGLGAPKDRHPSPLVDLGLPAGTEVFSADDHISLAEDIFYERLPASMREHAPRIWYRDGAFELADLNSTNGSYVNNRPVQGSAQVVNGSELRFGDIRFTLRF